MDAVPADMLIVVVDTNVLLQCRPFRELPWADLGDELRVVIPYACIKEIDRHKGDGNARRAKRARLAASMFSEALASTLARNPIAGQPTHTWELGSGRLAEHSALDKNVSDDQLVAEGLSLASETGDPALILSGDTIVRLKARTVGLKFMDIPEEWLLPPEQSESDKKLISLEKRLKVLESSSAQLAARIQVGANPALIDFIQGSARRCRDLTKAEVDKLVALAKQRYPMASEAVTEDPAEFIRGASMLRGRIVRPSVDDFVAYQRVHYPRWIESVRAWIDSCARRRSESLSVIQCVLHLENSGTVPADRLIFEYRTTRGALLMPPDNDDAKRRLALPRFPLPPEVPKPRFEPPDDHFSPLLANPFFDVAENRSNREPSSFYWQERPETTVERHAFECEEFRHGYSKEFPVTLLLPSVPDPGNMAMLLSATARNMPTPWELSLPIRYDLGSNDPMDELKALIGPSRVTLVIPKDFTLGDK